jgi:hypothetical protein
MGRLRVRWAGDDGDGKAKRYRWQAPRYRCPACDAALVPVVRPIGIVLQVAMGVVLLGGSAWIMFSDDGVGWALVALVDIATLAMTLLLALACSTWGFRYRRASEREADQLGR